MAQIIICSSSLVTISGLLMILLSLNKTMAVKVDGCFVFKIRFDASMAPTSFCVTKFSHVLLSYTLEVIYRLTPCPTAHRVQGCLSGVTVPAAGPRSNLPNRPLSTCIGYSK